MASDTLKRASETVGVLEQRLAASQGTTTGGDGPVDAEEILGGGGRDQIASVSSGLIGSEEVVTLKERCGAPVNPNNLHASRHQTDADLPLNTDVKHEEQSCEPKALGSQVSPSPTPPVRGMPERDGVEGVETVTTSVSLCDGGMSDRLLRPEAAPYGDSEDTDAASARQRITTPQDTTVDAVLGREILLSRKDTGLEEQDMTLGEMRSFEGPPAGAILSSQRASSISKAFVEDIIQSACPSKEVMRLADPLNARRSKGYSSDVKPPIAVDDNAGEQEREKFDDVEHNPFCKDISAGEIAAVKVVSSPRVEGSDNYVRGSSSNSRSSGSWTSRSSYSGSSSTYSGSSSTYSGSSERTQSSSTGSESSEQTRSSQQTAATLSSSKRERAGSVGISRQSSVSAGNLRHSGAEAVLDQPRSVNDEQPIGEGHLAASVGGSRLDQSMLRTGTLAGESDVLAGRQIVEVEGGPGDDLDHVGDSAQSTRSSASLHFSTPTAPGTKSSSSEERRLGSRSSGSGIEPSEDGSCVNHTLDSSVKVKEESSAGAGPVSSCVSKIPNGGFVTSDDPTTDDR